MPLTCEFQVSGVVKRTSENACELVQYINAIVKINVAIYAYVTAAYIYVASYNTDLLSNTWSGVSECHSEKFSWSTLSPGKGFLAAIYLLLFIPERGLRKRLVVAKKLELLASCYKYRGFNYITS